MAGYCKISNSQISDTKVVIQNCRRCRYYVPNGLYGARKGPSTCWDFNPKDQSKP